MSPSLSPFLIPLSFPEKARRRAYGFALERGGGELPPYYPDAATGDFWRAAGEVRAQRVAK